MKERTKWRCGILAAVAVTLAALLLLLRAPAPATAADAATAFTVTTSSDIKSPDGTYSPAHLRDDDLSTSWKAGWQNEKHPDCNEWLLLDFGAVVKVNSVTLYRHPDGTCFPSAFSFSWSVGGELFETIPGFTQTDYAPEPEDFSGERFRLRTVARYIRINITARTQSPHGNYEVSFAEVEASTATASAAEIEEATRKDAAFVRRPVIDDKVLPATASASSYNKSTDPSTEEELWAPSHINDGKTSSQWAADWGSDVETEACDEWIVLAFPSPQYVTGVTVDSHANEHYGFPKAFAFSYSLDGEHYFPVEGAEYADEKIGALTHVKVFSAPTVMTHLRMNITASYGDSEGNYIPQLAELAARGRAATETEVADATTAFNKLLGQGDTQAFTHAYGSKKPTAVWLAFAIVALLGAAGAGVCAVLFGGKKTSTAKEEQ